jgi:hypothetical protein
VLSCKKQALALSVMFQRHGTTGGVLAKIECRQRQFRFAGVEYGTLKGMARMLESLGLGSSRGNRAVGKLERSMHAESFSLFENEHGDTLCFPVRRPNCCTVAVRHATSKSSVTCGLDFSCR